VLLPIMSVVVSMSAGLVGGLLLAMLLASHSKVLPLAPGVPSQSSLRWAPGA
jgi:hypothetical protein